MYEFLDYRVRHVMTGDPCTVAPDATLEEAQSLFASRDFNLLPVVASDGSLAGVLTKLDALKAFAFTTETAIPRYRDVVRRPVADFMTPGAHSVDPELPLTRVLERMAATRHRSLPVVEDGRVVGVIAREDVLRAIERAVAGRGPAD